MDVLIIGAGGHGLVVADVLFAMQRAGQPVRPVGFLDDNAALHGRELQGLSVKGAVDDLGMVRHDALILGIGDNKVRGHLFVELTQHGAQFVSAIHPSAVISPSAQIDAGCLVCAGVMVNPLASIMENTILNTGCTVDHHCRVGPHAHVAPGVHLGGEVVVKGGAFVGLGASVAPRVRLGAWSTVGVGAAVVADVAEGATVAGVPAKPVAQKGGK